ncbi:class I adenylate-forming enzyme family protein [Streptomyces sp. MB09-02B]|nr:class I adenylate-forming enzyme family protein [Streptomyces sp. MB09-02B]MDX3639074.1 class I adenylate-forming enzyme family protein [Streptomyces sp. MB09-02B]
MRPHDMGTLFDDAAAGGARTVFHLDRPFDIAPRAGTRWTVAELAALVRATAARLTDAGVRPGDRVAIVKDNHWDYDLLACAAVRVGAVPAQLSARLDTPDLLTLLRRLRPAALVTTSAVLARCRDAAAAAPVCITVDTAVPGATHLAALDASGPGAPVRRHEDEPLVIHHTSGTTGVPKLVVHSTRTLVHKLARLEAVRHPGIGLRRDDVLCNASAFAHGRTFCWTAVVMALAPARIVVLTGDDPDTADPLLRAYPPTVVEALPATYVRLRPLTARLDNPFRRVRLYISTYDAMHPPALRTYLTASRHAHPLWMQGWGQTETGPLTFRFHTRGSALAPDAASATRRLGRPVPVRTRLRVVDPDTLRPVPRGRPGLLLVRTPALALGYVGEQERWEAKRVGDWWSTGDVGVHHRDGSVSVLDREADTLPGMSCLRTEDLLEQRLPQALECVIVGAPDGDPLPAVVTADGRLDPDAWKQAAQGLPAMRQPAVLTWDEVPRTGTGKVRRAALARYLTGTAVTGTGRWT